MEVDTEHRRKEHGNEIETKMKGMKETKERNKGARNSTVDDK